MYLPYSLEQLDHYLGQIWGIVSVSKRTFAPLEVILSIFLYLGCYKEQRGWANVLPSQP